MSDGAITLIREIEDEVYGYCVVEIEVEYSYFRGWNGGRWAIDPPEEPMCAITWSSHRLTDEEEQEAERIALYEHERGLTHQPEHRSTLGFSELERLRRKPWHHDRDCAYVTTDGPAPCTCRAGKVPYIEVDDYVPF